MIDEASRKKRSNARLERGYHELGTRRRVIYSPNNIFTHFKGILSKSVLSEVIQSITGTLLNGSIRNLILYTT